MDMFKLLTPPKELSLSERVEKEGGAQVIKGNDALLRELLLLENTAGEKYKAKGLEQETQRIHGLKSGGLKATKNESSGYGISDLKRDLQEGLDVAIETNLEKFGEKFTIQQRQLQEELSKVVHEESDRVIDAVNRGPHDLIKHTELKAIWKEMVWTARACDYFC